MKKIVALLLTLVLLMGMIPMASALASNITMGVGRFAPGTLTQGQVYNISGKITSRYKLTSVTVGVYYPNGKVTGQTKTVNPNATSYDISNLASYVKPSAVQPGLYALRVIAKDAVGTVKPLVYSSFRVVSSGSTASTSSGQPTSIQTAGSTKIYVGDTVKWTASVLPSNASQSLHWASGYPAVATVDQNGNITAHRAGQANITITASNGLKKTLLLTVYNKPQPVVYVPIKTLTNIGSGSSSYDWLTSSSSLTDNYGNTFDWGVSIYDGALEYLLDGKYQRFVATIYVREGTTTSGQLGTLKIVADGKEIYKSPAMTKISKCVPVDVNIAGYNDVQIIGSGSYYVYIATPCFVK